MLQRTDNQHKNVKKICPQSLFNWSHMVQDSNQSCKEIGSIHLLFMIELRSVIDPKEVTRWIKIQRNVYLNNMHFCKI